MSRPRRRGQRLTEDQFRELASEMVLLLRGHSVFDFDAARERAWREHEAEVRRRYRAEYSDAHRLHSPHPRAWLAYDAPEGERKPYLDAREDS